MSIDDNILLSDISEIDLRLIGPALRALRTEQGLRQTVVAERAGITKAMLSSYETGKCSPVLTSLTAVLRVLRSDLRSLQDTMDRLSLAAGVRPTPEERLSLESELGRAVLQLVNRLMTARRESEDPATETEEIPAEVPGP